MQRAITRREPCIVLRSPLVALNIDDQGRSPPRQTSPRSKQGFPEPSARSFLSPAWKVLVARGRLVRMVSQQMLPLRVSANLCSAVGTADTVRSRTSHLPLDRKIDFVNANPKHPPIMKSMARPGIKPRISDGRTCRDMMAIQGTPEITVIVSHVRNFMFEAIPSNRFLSDECSLDNRVREPRSYEIEYARRKCDTRFSRRTYSRPLPLESWKLPFRVIHQDIDSDRRASSMFSIENRAISRAILGN